MNYRTERLPVVTFSLMGINTLVYLISLLCYFRTDGESDVWIFQHLWLAPADSPWYSWFTSMFVHENFLHLGGNMLYFFLFGCCVEDMIGRGRFLLFYLLGGFAAELVFILTQPLQFGSHIPLGGASGAIGACMGMFLWLRADVEIEFVYFAWLAGPRGGRFEVSAGMAIGLWFLIQLFWTILSIMYPNAIGGVAFGAHVGGFLAGLGLVALCRLRAPEREIETEATPISATLQAVAEARKKLAAARPISSPEPPPAPAAPPAPVETPTIYLDENGVQTGPHTLTQIQTRLQKKELTPESLYWSDGMAQWESVRDLAPSPM